MTTITSKEFGTVYDGQKVTLYTLSNGTMEVDIMSYGATLVAIRTPDAEGKMRDVLCGWENRKAWSAGCSAALCEQRLSDLIFNFNKFLFSGHAFVMAFFLDTDRFIHS